MTNGAYTHHNIETFLNVMFGGFQQDEHVKRYRWFKYCGI